MKKNIHLSQSSTTAGFTLVEFIVIMSIFAIMVGVVLFNFTSFRSRVTLDNLAHDIALSLRQIQTSAGGALTVNLDDPGTEYFRGIAFTVDSATNQVEKKLIQYQSNDQFYTNGSDQELDVVFINTPDIIKGISFGSNIEDIIESDQPISINQYPISIAFQRFRTNAYFSAGLEPKEDQYLCIHLQSPGSTEDVKKRHVCVSVIGQISIH